MRENGQKNSRCSGIISKEKFVLPDPKDRSRFESCMCAVAKGLALLRADRFVPIDVDDVP